MSSRPHLFGPSELDAALRAHELGESLREHRGYNKAFARRMGGSGIRRGLRGPRGGGVGWMPTDLASLIAWYRADQYNPTTGTWTDLSGNGNHATQGTAANRPTAGTRFSQPSVEFDGVNDFVRCTSFAGGTLTQPTPIYAVADLDTASGTKVITDGPTAGDRHALWWNSTSWNMLSPTVLNMVGGNANDGTVNAFAAVFNGPSSLGYFDDWSTDICTGNPGTHQLGGLTIGATFVGTGSWDGGISDIIVVNAHSAADQENVKTYFADRYGLTIG